ncbi:MAG: type II toxin-antitoxin system HicB family antitoxin [bacterium]|nr:type II toxin-antitoxin system HicB family antitoxin [bacterium]
MARRYILSEYLDNAIEQAVYDKLKDGKFTGRIPRCKGVIAFEKSLSACGSELRSVLEDWILLGLKMGHNLPVIKNIDLHKAVKREPVGTVQKSGGR